MNESRSDLERAMSVHSQLLNLVDPATPDTIRSSTLSKNYVLVSIALIGLIGFLMLIFSNFLSSFFGEHNTVWLRISSAILGATLHAFWSARTFLQEGTFNSQYSQDYIVRFGIGVVTGFVLGSILT